MKRRMIFVFTLILSAAIFSCSDVNSQKIFDNFNAEFSPNTNLSAGKNSIKSDSFDPDRMLNDSYLFSDTTFFCISAPSDGVSYSWYVIVQNEKSLLKPEKILVSDKKDFAYKMPGVFRFGDNIKNYLQLEVIDENGEMYSDKARVVLYKK